MRFPFASIFPDSHVHGSSSSSAPNIQHTEESNTHSNSNYTPSHPHSTPTTTITRSNNKTRFSLVNKWGHLLVGSWNRFRPISDLHTTMRLTTSMQIAEQPRRTTWKAVGGTPPHSMRKMERRSTNTPRGKERGAEGRR